MKNKLCFVAVFSLIVLLFGSSAYSQTSLLRLKAASHSNPNGADETVIYFTPGASDDFEATFDALKIMNNDPAIPNIYSILPGRNIAGNGMPPLIGDKMVKIGVQYATNGDFTINATQISNFPATTDVYILDSILNISQKLNATPIYSFNYTGAPSALDKRFKICFDYLGVGKPVVSFIVNTNPVEQGIETTISLKGTAPESATYVWDFDGGVVVSGSGAGPYQIKWNTTGNKKVTCTIKALCFTSDPNSVNVSVVPPADATITPGGPTTFCFGGSVVLNANTGLGFTYQWYVNGGIIDNATNSSYTATLGGSYTVVVNSSTSAPVVVTINPVPDAIATPLGNTSFCTGESVVINANYDASYTYQWVNGPIYLSGESNTTYTANETGNYAVIVKNSFECTKVSNYVPVTVNLIPTVTISNVGADLSANPSTGLTYQWYIDGIPIDGATDANYTALATGNYTVRVLGPISACEGESNSLFIEVGSDLDASLIADSNPVCAGFETGIIAYATGGTGEYTYSWSTDESSQDIIVAPTETTTYTVTISDGNNSIERSIEIVVNQFPVPTINYDGFTTFCSGGSLTLHTGFVEGYTYQWTLDFETIQDATNNEYDAFESGYYNVIVSNQGCTNSAELGVDINAVTVDIETFPGGDVTINKGDDQTFTSSTTSTDVLTYQWRKDNVDILGATDSDYTILNAQVTDSGEYSLYVQDPSGCSAVSNSTNLIVLGPAPLDAEVSAESLTLCSGETTTVTALASGGSGEYSYAWSTDESTQDIIVTPTETTTYTVTVSDGTDQVEKSIIITVNQLPNPTIIYEGNTTICSGGSLNLSTEFVEGYTYQWTLDSEPIVDATTNEYDAAQTGNYNVTVSNQGCTKNTESGVDIIIVELPTIAVNPAGPITITSPQTVTLTASTGTLPSDASSYKWFKDGIDISASGSIYVAFESGEYTAVAYNDFGCSNTSNAVNVTVNEPEPLTADVTADPSTICAGQTSTVKALPTGGTGEYTYIWSPGGEEVSSFEVTPDITTTYYVTVSDGDQTYEGSVVVKVNPIPNANISASGSTEFCEGGSVILSTTQDENYSYQWWHNSSIIDGATNYRLFATNQGDYIVVVTSFGCTKTSNPRTVIVNPIPAATINPSGVVNIDEGNSIVLKANQGQGYTYQWFLNGEIIDGATGNSYEANANGDYTVIVYNNDCSKESDITTIHVIIPSECPSALNLKTTKIGATSVTVSWVASNANYLDWWIVRLAPIGTKNFRYRKVYAGTTATFGQLSVNTNYYCQVRAKCNKKFEYTEPLNFTTLIVNPGECPVVTGLYHSDVTAKNAVAHWNFGQNITRYTIRIYAVGGDGYHYRKVGNVNSYLLQWLNPNTTYVWDMKAFCDGNGKTRYYRYSDTFTTPMAKLAPASVNSDKVSVYPNPTEGSFELFADKYQDKTLNVSLFDMAGQKLIEDVLNNDSGNFYKQFDISGLAKGVYLLKVESKSGVDYRKVFLQ